MDEPSNNVTSQSSLMKTVADIENKISKENLSGDYCPEYLQENLEAEFKGVHNLVITKLDKKELLLPKISSDLKKNALAIITAVLITNDVNFDTTNDEVTLSLYCGLHTIYLEFINVPAIAHYLLKLGYKVEEVSIEEWTSWVALRNKTLTNIVAHYFHENEDTLLRLAWTLLGPILCLLGHRPNESNIMYWGAKILRTISIATDLPIEFHSSLFYPSINFCKVLPSILDNICEIRRHMFYTVYNRASSIPSLPGTVCRLVVELLRGVGLLDFILIDHFLLIQNPFSLLLNSVAKRAPELLKAYEKFMQYGHLAPWCSILASPEDLKVFNEPEVKYVAAIARGIAVEKGLLLLENYHPFKENQDIINTVEKAVKLQETIRVEKTEREK
ncbi:hypothetical protein O3M35_001245 [Rhynocoris fuscipes]|uniref:Uncharacterized protein n=1 Tax=Rhynocoris fuscipes TaxID=488301 RepID=A0AAW1DQA7_9HEMI